MTSLYGCYILHSLYFEINPVMQQQDMSFKESWVLKFKDLVWPIRKEELETFIPMGVLLACLLYNFGTLRSIKDSIIVPEIGAEVISFMKLYLVLPSALLFTIFYFKLSNLFTLDKLFLIMVSSFLILVFVFGFILYPYQDYLQPSADTIHALIDDFPHLKWFLLIYGKWSYGLMYIVSELWGVIIIQLIYWQFANNYFKTSQATRLYPILNLIGNIGLVTAGISIMSCANRAFITKFYTIGLLTNHYLNPENAIKILCCGVILAGCGAMITFRIALNKFMENQTLNHSAISKQTKTTLPLLESIKLVLRSRYIGYIVMMIICYGLALNIIEGPWKAKLRELYPTTREYLGFLGNFNLALGITGLIGAFVYSNIIRKSSWRNAALVAPIIIGATGILLFSFIIFSNSYNQQTIFGVSILLIVVVIGSIQNILSKSTKYTLFDSTKELAYIPLSKELRTKGKAAADVIGAKFGKSLGAFVQSSVFMIIPGSSFDSLYISLAIIFCVIIFSWSYSVYKLGYEYNQIVHNNNAKLL